MAVVGLDHYALLSSDPERTPLFYTGIVGLRVGPRPELSFPGIWLYAGDHPIVHVIFGKSIPSKETGAVDHLAFVARGSVDNTLETLKRNGIGSVIAPSSRAERSDPGQRDLCQRVAASEWLRCGRQNDRSEAVRRTPQYFRTSGAGAGGGGAPNT